MFHQWCGYSCFVFGSIHSIVLLWQYDGQQDEIDWTESAWWWTGTVVWVSLTWLTVLGLPPVRRALVGYEFFKIFHFLAAIVFVWFMFVHVDFGASRTESRLTHAVLTSPDYLIAAAAVYLPSVFYRIFMAWWRKGALATIEQVGEHHVLIHRPTAMKWTPGQRASGLESFLTHADVYIRLSFGIHAFTSHPLTICSVAPGDAQFLVRVHTGVTARLLKAAQLGNPVRVWMDGPYSGLNFDLTTARLDHIMLIGAGSGVSFVAPMMSALAHARKDAETKTTVRVIVSVRQAESINWLQERFEQARNANLEVELHVTGPIEKEELEKDGSEARYVYGRPNVEDAVSSVFDKHGRAFIAVCGPEKMIGPVNNAFARGQMAIVKGEAVADDVQIHAEVFNW